MVKPAGARQTETMWDDARLDPWELKAGHYLEIAGYRYDLDGPRPGEAYARIERLESGPIDLIDSPIPSLSRPMIAFCHGMPGAVVADAGTYFVAKAISARRLKQDTAEPWWSLPAGPVFRGATLKSGPTSDVVPTEIADDETEVTDQSRRRATSYSIPARGLSAGDYLQILSGQHPDHACAPDEGFHRVYGVRIIDPDDAARVAGPPVAGDAGLVVVGVRGLRGVLLLEANRPVQKLAFVNPERDAYERPDDGDDDLYPELTLARQRRPDEEALSAEIDASCRTDSPDDEADLYSIEPDPDARRMLLQGIEGVRPVNLSELPWPHLGSKCDLFPRRAPIAATYPDAKVPGASSGWEIGQAASAEMYAVTSPSDRARCSYHKANWTAIGSAAEAILADGCHDPHQLLGRAKDYARLAAVDRPWLVSLFADPIVWSDDSTALTNGQHRLCALRAAGVRSCPVEGRFIPGRDVPQTISPVRHARATVDRYWSDYLAVRLNNPYLGRLVGTFLARNRWARRFLRGPRYRG
ncbi:hypothetical protein ABIA31_007948 [Catenulispora sp. MAP5-51]|uniref:hypothetical protein n=1 Tax=Catenulispora sp. MAP5-51 TaxID=3156298 RepID=UPI003512D628